VATGFDASYFSQQQAGTPVVGTTPSAVPISEPDEPLLPPMPKTKADDEMSKIDMDLDADQDAAAADFKSDHMPNIWTLDDANADDDDHDDIPMPSKSEEHHTEIKEPESDSELEKPSFLRRLAKRVNKEHDDTDPSKSA
jgi:hypothetical protein